MYANGKHAALGDFGLRDWWQNFDAKQTAKDLGHAGRVALVGAPGTWKALGNQARAGTLTAPPPPSGDRLQSGMYHRPFDWLAPKLDFGRRGMPIGQRLQAAAGTGLSLLGPLGLGISTYQALKTPPEHRGEALGQLAGGLAGGALGGPFGIAGQLVGGSLGTAAGGAVGKLFAPRPKPPEVAETPPDVLPNSAGSQ